jgi:hypothetical protein
MASWDREAEEDGAQVFRCLACGKRLDERLAVLGSLRCLDCRAASADLDQQLIASVNLPPAADATQEHTPVQP